MYLECYTKWITVIYFCLVLSDEHVRLKQRILGWNLFQRKWRPIDHVISLLTACAGSLSKHRYKTPIIIFKCLNISNKLAPLYLTEMILSKSNTGLLSFSNDNTFLVIPEKKVSLHYDCSFEIFWPLPLEPCTKEDQRKENHDIM